MVRTEIRLYAVDGIQLHVAVLVEQILVYFPSAKQPDVAVVRHGTLSLISHVEVRTLCLSLHWTHDVRNSKQPQQLLTCITQQSD